MHKKFHHLCSSIFQPLCSLILCFLVIFLVNETGAYWNLDTEGRPDQVSQDGSNDQEASFLYFCLLQYSFSRVFQTLQNASHIASIQTEESCKL